MLIIRTKLAGKKSKDKLQYLKKLAIKGPKGNRPASLKKETGIEYLFGAKGNSSEKEFKPSSGTLL